MRGSLRHRSPGSWELRWPEQDSVTDKWKTRSTTFRGTKKPADAKLAELVSAINTGNFVEPSKLTMREFLEGRLRDYVGTTIDKPKTRVYYTTIVRRHLIAALGAVLLTKLTAARVQEYYRAKIASGRVNRKGEPTGEPLSPTTVHGHHQTLH